MMAKQVSARKKFPLNDPNNAKTENFIVFLLYIGTFCTVFELRAQKGLKTQQ